MAQAPRAAWIPGTRVRLRGDAWTVVTRTGHADCTALELSSNAAAPSARTFLLPFDKPRPLESPRKPVLVRRRRWLHDLRQLWTAAHPFGGLGTAATARIELMPFQLEPALAMLRHGRLRLLIADEVGLGKTIQAGLLLNELCTQVPEFRALALTPAGVREQWQTELRSRFALQSTLADADWLAARARELPPGINPWTSPGIFVASLDLVKRPEVLRALEDVTWDLVVVDEVHGAGLGTARLAAAHAIASRSRRVVLLTATPPDDEPRHFDAIARIGALSATDEVGVFRRRREDAGIRSTRKTVLLPIRLSPAERRMHRLLDRYSTLVVQEADALRDPGGTLAVVVLRKRALSSARSLAVSVRRRLVLLGTRAADPSEQQLLLPIFDEDPLADAAPDELLRAPGLADAGRERMLLEELAAAADSAARAESKAVFLRRYLRRVNEPVVVFTEYRDTLAQLAEAVASVRTPLLLHGAMNPTERARVQRAFNGSGTLLLATDAASEGLNLHHRCRAVVHFELPWMPMRLEQRTGRVDRLGQTRPVHEVLLVARHTCERLVLAPLFQRARAAAASGGRSSLSSLAETRIAAAVLRGDAVPDLVVAAPLSPAAEISLRDEARHEVDRLSSLRALSANVQGARAARRHQTLVSLAPRSAERMAVVLRIAVECADGRILHEALVPLSVDASIGGKPLTQKDALEAARELMTRHTPLLASGASVQLTAAASGAAGARLVMTALADRERAMVRQPSAALRLVQAGLFDHRAVHQARDRAQVATALLEEAESRVTSLEQATLHTSIGVAAIYIGAPIR